MHAGVEFMAFRCSIIVTVVENESKGACLMRVREGFALTFSSFSLFI